MIKNWLKGDEITEEGMYWYEPTPSTQPTVLKIVKRVDRDYLWIEDFVGKYYAVRKLGGLFCKIQESVPDRLRTYLTSYQCGNHTYASYVRARNLKNAQNICTHRGLNEVIVGTTEVIFNEFDLASETDPHKLYHGLIFMVWVLCRAGKLVAIETISDTGILHDYQHYLLGHHMDKSQLMKRVAEIQTRYEALSYES